MILSRKSLLNSIHQYRQRNAQSLIIGLIATAWISASVVQTLANKKLMTHWPLPLSLMSLQLMGSVAGDWLLINSRGTRLLPTTTQRFQQLFTGSIIAGALSVVTKGLTLACYQQLSVSLTHTIKSSSPLFSMFFSRVILGQQIHSLELIAVIPITLGVALSSTSAFKFAIEGLVAAIVSTSLGVIQSMISKYFITQCQISPLVFHFLSAVAALFLATPLALMVEINTIITITSSKHVEKKTDDTFPMLILALSFIAHYIQSVGSIILLSRISVVGHQVTNVLKRIAVIVASVLYFGTVLTVKSWLGISLAISGFAFYVITHAMRKSESWQRCFDLLSRRHLHSRYFSHIISRSKDSQENKKDFLERGALYPAPREDERIEREYAQDFKD